MLDTALLHRLHRIEQLPSMPPIVAEALQLLSLPEVNAATVAQLIERDQALTARLLRIANSPYYGFPRTITTVRLAISLLGNDAVRELLVAATLYEFLHTGADSDWDRQLFWRYCLYCAAAARHTARLLGYQPAGEAFTAGLLHDIGVLLLAAYLPAEFTAILRYQQRSGCSYVEAEQAVLGTSHAEIGSWLAERWNLPPVLIATIAYHHTTEPLPPVPSPKVPSSSVLHSLPQPLTALVALAEYLAHWAELRRWTGETTLSSPLAIPDSVHQHLLAHGMIDSEGKPTPALSDTIAQAYASLVQAPW
jgi:HD-like signal output (HDOD) protein